MQKIANDDGPWSHEDALKALFYAERAARGGEYLIVEMLCNGFEQHAREEAQEKLANQFRQAADNAYVKGASLAAQAYHKEINSTRPDPGRLEGLLERIAYCSAGAPGDPYKPFLGRMQESIDALRRPTENY